MTTRARIKVAMTIDDEKIDQMLYKRIMKRSGLVETILPFRMAEDALDHLRTCGNDTVDVIFLDINMPRMNGFEFLRQATEEFGPSFARRVVIMLTTSLDPADEERARQYEVVRDYMQKPFSVEALEKVADMLDEAA